MILCIQIQNCHRLSDLVTQILFLIQPSRNISRKWIVIEENDKFGRLENVLSPVCARGSEGIRSREFITVMGRRPSPTPTQTLLAHQTRLIYNTCSFDHVLMVRMRMVL